MKEQLNLDDLDNVELSKPEKFTPKQKKLIIAGVAALIIILIIIIIVVSVNSSSSSSSKKKKIGEFNCTFELDNISNKTKILSKDYKKNSDFDIYIDNKKVSFTNEYKFNKAGLHNITYVLYEDINMDYMFKDVPELTSIILFSEKNAKIKSMISAFESCKSLKNFLNTGFNLDELKSIKKLFYGTSITTFNLKNFNLKNIEDMSYLFAFSEIEEINLSDFDTSNTKNMSYMFYSCKSLVSLYNINIYTSNVIDMSFMFSS